MNQRWKRVAGRSVAILSGLALAAGCGGDASDDDTQFDNCSMVSVQVPNDAPPNGIVGEPYATKWPATISTYQASSPPPGLDAQLQGTPAEAGTYDVSVRVSNECESRDVTYSIVVEDLPPQCDDDEDCAILAAPFVDPAPCKKDGDCADDDRCIVVTSTLSVCASAEESGALVCGQCLRAIDVAPVGSTIESLTFCVFDEGETACNVKPKACSSARHCVAP